RRRAKGERRKPTKARPDVSPSCPFSPFAFRPSPSVYTPRIRSYQRATVSRNSSAVVGGSPFSHSRRSRRGVASSGARRARVGGGREARRSRNCRTARYSARVRRETSKGGGSEETAAG